MTRTMSALIALIVSERAVQTLDPALLRLERAGLLQQLVDHDAQVLAAELRAAGARRWASLVRGPPPPCAG
jgi:hypothetical protein